MSLYSNLKNVQDNAEIEKANKQKESKYQEELKRYNDIVNNSTENTQNGYVRNNLGNKLIFDNEPNATLTTYGDHIKRIEDVKVVNGLILPSSIKSDNLDNNSVLKTSNKDQYLYLQKNKSLLAEYTNLSNSYFMDNKIAKVRYKYTLTEVSNGTNSIVLRALSDPTFTVFIHSNIVGSEPVSYKVKIDASFYDERGNEIVPNDKDYFLLTFASLNSISGTGEYVSDYNGKFEYINGSAITSINGKALNYSDKDISEYAKEQGSQDGKWDNLESEYAYVGAIVGKSTDRVSLEIGNNNRGYWFALNTKLKVKNIPSYPRKPNLTPLKPIEKLPCKQPECYQGCHECCCDSIDLNNSMEDNLLKVDAKIDKMFNQICILKTANCSNRALLVSQYAYKMWCLLNDIMLLLAWLIIKKRSK